MLIVVCSSVLFLLTIVLYVLLRYTDSDYPFGIFKIFFLHTSYIFCIVKQLYNGSDTSYNLTRSSPLVSFIFFEILDCTDRYQKLIVVTQYNKSDYSLNAIKIISHPFILNVNKSLFFSWYLEVVILSIHVISSKNLLVTWIIV